MKPVRKAVIPAAGLGTRFLPATKAIPKEMLPIIDKPTIQYVVEEAVDSGLNEIVFVTRKGKNSIEDHFDTDLELETALQGKEDLLKTIQAISRMISITSVRQKEPLGLGHAVLVTRHAIGDEPFGVCLGDDIILGERPCMRQLLDVYEATGCSVVAVMEVPWETVSRYGLVSVRKQAASSRNYFEIEEVVEKPPRDAAPSNLAIMGRYLLTPGIFEALESTTAGALGELQLTDGIGRLQESEKVYACRFEGKRYDAGQKLDYLIASVELGLRHAEIGEEFRNYLKKLAPGI
jgi:UTP--glucose-1-phosphate uridylyltransferase